jgi:hypothetical protein
MVFQFGCDPFNPETSYQVQVLKDTYALIIEYEPCQDKALILGMRSLSNKKPGSQTRALS